MTTPTTSALDDAAATFRDALLRRDETTLRRLALAYKPVYQGIQAEIARLTEQIASARARGETVRPAWLRQRGRLEALERQVLEQWAQFADVAEAIITETQREAVQAAASEAAQLISAGIRDTGGFLAGSLTRLRPDALAELVGVLSDGSPLRSLLDELGRDAASQVEAALLRAVATGRGARQTAGDIRNALGGNLNRALTTARTEHMRAYRGASLQTYQANSDLLRGWQWRASPSRRTCPVCLAMDGREFGLGEPMVSHANCRCTMIPLLTNRPAPERRQPYGAEWFAQQDAATQRAMLGPGKFALYQQGRITLADLVEIRNDPRWGQGLRQRTLEELTGRA